LPSTGLVEPEAAGVPPGAQSWPQSELDLVLVVLVTAAPPLAEDASVVLEADVGVMLPVTLAVLVCVDALELVLESVEDGEPVLVPVPVALVPELPPQPAATRTMTSAATISDPRRIGVDPRGLLQALARFAHERDGLGEDDGHDRAQLLGLLFGRPLDVDAVDRGHRQVDGQLDRVVGPGETLRALHLLGELPELALQVVGISEQAAESTSFHNLHGSHLADGRSSYGTPGTVCAPAGRGRLA
jgi:hypothetical protein